MFSDCLNKILMTPSSNDVKCTSGTVWTVKYVTSRDIVPDIIDSGPICITDLFQNKGPILYLIFLLQSQCFMQCLSCSFGQNQKTDIADIIMSMTEKQNTFPLLKIGYQIDIRFIDFEIACFSTRINFYYLLINLVSCELANSQL